MFRTMDRDGDSKVTAAEMNAAQRRITGKGTSPLSAEEKIRAVDADRDGVLTRDEHVAGSARMFAAMDRDHDGRLTGGEYEAGHAKLLAKK